MHAIRSPRRRAQAASAEFRGCRLEVDHQLELGRSWAWRPHAEASYQPWLRWFRLRTAFCDFLEASTGCWDSSVRASDAVTAVTSALSGAVCGELEAATGCWESSVVASLVDAVTAGGIALSGACELDGDAVPCRLFGALIAGEAGETIVETVVLGLRGTAAMTDLPSTLASWPAICRTRPLAPAIDPHMMKATAHPALRRKLDHRPNSGCTSCAERMANPCKRANL